MPAPARAGLGAALAAPVCRVLDGPFYAIPHRARLHRWYTRIARLRREREGLRVRSQRAIRLGPAPRLGDLIAATGVVLVLVPQSLAYAELAGVPAVFGLYAAAVPPIAAAFFASSPYLQTGPTALTSLLALGVASAFAPPGSPAYIASVALLALIVGVVRIGVGLARLGPIAYFMSEPVVRGFTFAAGLLIFLSQVPVVLDIHPVVEGVIPQSIWAALNPATWRFEALALAAFTVAALEIGRRAVPAFPAVLLTVVVGVLYGRFTGYEGSVVGEVRAGLPMPSLDLPWHALPDLLVGGTVIAVIGFAEAATIARNYAAADRRAWSPNREFVSQGVANAVAAVAGAFPVGGSFSRSEIARRSGAMTRWSGALAGVMALAALPFVGLLETLPKAVLGGIVMYAVTGLIRIKPTLRLWRYSRPQFAVAAGTFVLSLLLAPRVDQALIIGVLLSLVVHLLRETRMQLEVRYNPEETTLHLIPRGVLWFASATILEDRMIGALAAHPDAQRMVVHFGGLGRIDTSGALTVSRFLSEARKRGLDVRLEGVPPQARRFVEPVFEREPEDL